MILVNIMKEKLNGKLYQALHFLVKPTNSKRVLFFLTSDIILCSLALFLSFLLRFDFKIPFEYGSNFPLFFLIFISLGFLCFFEFNRFFADFQAFVFQGLSSVERQWKIPESILDHRSRKPRAKIGVAYSGFTQLEGSAHRISG